MINKALSVLKLKYPDRKPIGYWEDGDNVIINTKPQMGPGAAEVCQFVVRPDGTVYGTNPAQCHVICVQPMKKL